MSHVHRIPKPKYKQTPLERATSIAEVFEATQRTMWSSMWPLGHCAVSSLLLNPLLVATTPEMAWAVVIGLYGEHRQHAWIQSAYGDVIDPTWSQFAEPYYTGPSLRVEPAHNAHQWFPEIELTPGQEDFYRRSINPRFVSSNDDDINGWTAGSKIKQLFGSRRREVSVNII